MADTSTTGVAVYIDFDNIVISRYDQVHGKGQFHRDKPTQLDDGRGTSSNVDLHAILDFASSYGTVVLTRAYADWSVPINSAYRKQLVDRAVDLVQLFAASGTKNGADIRLAVDAVEDVSRMPNVTHVLIVAGDSDFIPLAQRLKRLGRYVVAVGVAGATSRSLAAACDELVTYDNLPGITLTVAESTPEPEPEADPVTDAEPRKSTARKSTSAKKAASNEPDPRDVASRLLERALRLGHEKDEDAVWLHLAEVKNQMRRMDPSFNEKELGFKTFSEFIKSRKSIAELDESTQVRMIRLKPGR